MLIQSPGFYIKEFEVPAFTLAKGEMVRFWVEVVPQRQTDTDGYWVAKKTIQVINEMQQKKSWICPRRVKRGIFDVFRPVSLEKYLQDKFKLKEATIREKLAFFDLKPEYKVRNLRYDHQKIFPIICGFQAADIVSFDYYQLGPDLEVQLTAYVKSELKNGKAAISFDNLYYRSNTPDQDMISNYEIRRKY